MAQDISKQLPAYLPKLLDTVRAQNPLVQVITNFVAMDVTANVLLALGASPAMVHAPEEAADFNRLAASLSINIGTLSPPFLAGMTAACAAAKAQGKPWVLDPVGVGATPYRNKAVLTLLQFQPSVIRGNATEILALAKLAGLTVGDFAPTRGVDSTNSVAQAADAAMALAKKLGCVVAATGAQDFITDGTQSLYLGNGHPLMTKVTALGCALSASIAAMLAVERDVFLACSAMIALYGIAGELAFEQVSAVDKVIGSSGGSGSGPGSFRVAFVDALYHLQASDCVRVKILS